MIRTARASGDRYVLLFPLYCLSPFPNILNRDATTRHLSAVHPTNLQSVWKAKSESLHDTHHEYKERYVKFLFLSFPQRMLKEFMLTCFSFSESIRGLHPVKRLRGVLLWRRM